MSKGDIEFALRNNDPMTLSIAVLSAALHSHDAAWAESLCVQLAAHPDNNVRGNAILGFGHIARIHRKLNIESVRPLLEAALKDSNSYVRGQADSATDDVRHFLGWNIKKSTNKENRRTRQ